LPTDEVIQKALPKHFILDMPKSGVSADFLWIGELNGKDIIAVVDCTGHDISGAFMTMAGVAFLNRVLSIHDITRTDEILNELRELVMNLLKQREGEKNAEAGMDISLIMLDKERKTLQFSGANNPLYIVHEREMTIYKGDRMPIGVHLNFNQPFTHQDIKLSPGDMIYMFTDGYADQFGGSRNKKFRYRQLQELLLAIHDIPLSEQKEELYRTMQDWKGSNAQVDDILIVGFQV
jgi:serine phosphatase RsbU (regulator of sigma subunit)